MDERPSNPLLMPGVVCSSRGVGEGSRGEILLHSGRIERATRLAEIRASPLMIQREMRWSSSAFMIFVRVKMEDPQ